MRGIGFRFALVFLLFSAATAPAQERDRYAPPDQTKGAWERFWGNNFGKQFAAPTVRLPENEDQNGIAPVVRNGKLALTPEEAVRLALFNNVDLQVERYGPYASYWGIEKSQAAFNPSHLLSTYFNRLNTPNSNLLAGGLNLEQKTGLFDYTFRKPYTTGTDLEVNFGSRRYDTTSQFIFLNPSVATNLSIMVRQRWLRGFGRSNNLVSTRIARNNLAMSEHEFVRRAMEIIANVENVYWDLVHSRELLKVRKQSLDLAKLTLEHNQARVEAGTLASLDVVQAEAEVATRVEQVVVAEYGWRNSSDQLKTLISAQENPELTSAEVEALAPIEPLPEAPLGAEEAIRITLKHRPEMSALELELANRGLELDRAKNKRLPGLDLIAGYSQNGLGGNFMETTLAADQTLRLLRTGRMVPGGLGDSLSQLFRGKFLGYTIRMDLTVPLGNSEARAELAQGLIAERQARGRIKSMAKRIGLEVRDACRQLEMNRQRVETARAAVRFTEKKLEGEELKYSVGTSTTRFVLEAQRDLAEARLLEIRARVDFLKSMVTRDRAMGLTLAKHRVEPADALLGNRCVCEFGTM
ncbi:MAG: TolC family protein [Acidobacteria bacterium]|nr:TolC family protein [Acidobacteriota bacterium]MBI3657035.1 TolC family protein [Acidobacteriota bacterium]